MVNLVNEFNLYIKQLLIYFGPLCLGDSFKGHLIYFMD